MAKEKTQGSPQLGDMERAILKAFHEGLRRARPGQETSGRRRYVFNIEILLETSVEADSAGISTDAPEAVGASFGVEDDEMAKEKAPDSPEIGEMEEALTKAFYEGLQLPRRGEEAPGRKRIVFEIDILVEDGRLVHAIVNEVGAEGAPPPPTPDRMH